MKHLTEMVRQHKAGKTNAIYAVCSAHPLVLEAAIRYASANQTPLLIEATSNQVDQFGGYTGMTPADFRGFVCQLADSLNFPQDALILGGDHLGPNRWQNLPAAQAMANADDLIKSYVAAGFKKIHLDCSMSCQDDPIPLTDDIVAEPPPVWRKWRKKPVLNTLAKPIWSMSLVPKCRYLAARMKP